MNSHYYYRYILTGVLTFLIHLCYAISPTTGTRDPDLEIFQQVRAVISSKPNLELSPTEWDELIRVYEFIKQDPLSRIFLSRLSDKALTEVLVRIAALLYGSSVYLVPAEGPPRIGLAEYSSIWGIGYVLPAEHIFLISSRETGRPGLNPDVIPFRKSPRFHFLWQNKLRIAEYIQTQYGSCSPEGFYFPLWGDKTLSPGTPSDLLNILKSNITRYLESAGRETTLFRDLEWVEDVVLCAVLIDAALSAQDGQIHPDDQGTVLIKRLSSMFSSMILGTDRDKVFFEKLISEKESVSEQILRYVDLIVREEGRPVSHAVIQDQTASSSLAPLSYQLMTPQSIVMLIKMEMEEEGSDMHDLFYKRITRIKGLDKIRDALIQRLEEILIDLEDRRYNALWNQLTFSSKITVARRIAIQLLIAYTTVMHDITPSHFRSLLVLGSSIWGEESTQPSDYDWTMLTYSSFDVTKSHYESRLKLSPIQRGAVYQASEVVETVRRIREQEKRWLEIHFTSDESGEGGEAYLQVLNELLRMSRIRSAPILHLNLSHPEEWDEAVRGKDLDDWRLGLLQSAVPLFGTPYSNFMQPIPLYLSINRVYVLLQRARAHREYWVRNKKNAFEAEPFKMYRRVLEASMVLKDVFDNLPPERQAQVPDSTRDLLIRYQAHFNHLISGGKTSVLEMIPDGGEDPIKNIEELSEVSNQLDRIAGRHAAGSTDPIPMEQSSLVQAVPLLQVLLYKYNPDEIEGNFDALMKELKWKSVDPALLLEPLILARTQGLKAGKANKIRQRILREFGQDRDTFKKELVAILKSIKENEAKSTIPLSTLMSA
ncbi:MAG: hypothetical protein JW774_12350 [Candidatus Aureabacteria bacterium]|nr:hypothetical protein [Candidatus Auribacterota bacterium]